jgi:hypothetical protein
MKNRPPVDLTAVNVEALDTAGFLKKVRGYDSHLPAQRRSDLSDDAKTLLNRYENQIVSLTGWLVLVYPGPPETTNCGDRNFSDWHLEIFQNSSDHPPQIGDPTPIICEIAPRTEAAIYHGNIRLQSLAGFFRTGKQYESTGHPITKPVLIAIPYGETTLQPGQRLELVGRSADKIRVKYLNRIYDIPVAAIQ